MARTPREAREHTEQLRSQAAGAPADAADAHAYGAAQPGAAQPGTPGAYGAAQAGAAPGSGAYGAVQNGMQAAGTQGTYPYGAAQPGTTGTYGAAQGAAQGAYPYGAAQAAGTQTGAAPGTYAYGAAQGAAAQPGAAPGTYTYGAAQTGAAPDPNAYGTAGAPGNTIPFLEHERAAKKAKPHKPNPLARIVNQWCARLLGALADHTFTGQEAEYASGRTTRDFVWNTLGLGAFGMVFPLLTVVVTQLTDVERAGMFSLAYVAASLLLIVGNFGMRPYQVSDITEQHSFADYQLHRILTCAAMILAGLAYCWARGYSDEMLFISMGIYCYKAVDALADVYEGRLQQADKLYLGGLSQALRSVVVLVGFTIVLAVSNNLMAACIAMPICALATFLVVTLPLSLLETPKSQRVKLRNVADLFKQCAPLFGALFLYTFIDYMPVFVMESVLSYDNQLYYNALYFPAQFIALAMSMVYKPLLLRLANFWADRSMRRRFDLITIGIVALIAAFTALVVAVMGWIGLPVMSFMYGLDFEQFRGLSYIFLVAGGVTAVIDFLYQIIAVLHRQQSIIKLYAIAFGFALFVPVLLVNFTGLPGAIIGYLIVMCILMVLMVWEYLRIRIQIMKDEKAAAAAAEAQDIVHLRPSEQRAERQRRAAVHAKWEARAANSTRTNRR